MEKDKGRRETEERGNWWDEYSPDKLLDVIIFATKAEGPENLSVAERRAFSLRTNASSANEIGLYIQAHFPEAPLKLLEAFGAVTSILTPPQCTELSVHPSVASITPDVEMHAV